MIIVKLYFSDFELAPNVTMHTFVKIDIPVNDGMIKKFAQRYVEQRTQALTPAKSISPGFLFKSTGFDTSELEKTIMKNVIAEDKKRELGITPAVLNDIYRSDLGELLMTYYFEEKVPEGERFKIPVKNISNRELCHLPGRGLDAIGYRVDGTKIRLLFGEAKVSHSSDSPPAVVHGSDDSIYKTHLKHCGGHGFSLKKLSEYYKHLNPIDATPIGIAIWAMNNKKTDVFDITLGCTLVRDHVCVKEEDYGKLKTDAKSFVPHIVHFSLLAFSGKTIEETIQMFFEEVQRIAA